MTVLQVCRSNSEVATGFATSKDRFATGRASAEPRYDTRASRVIPNKAQNTILSRRNNSTVRAANELPRWGVRAWGDAIMTEIGEWKERRDQVARYRVLEEETTDPLAASLLHDIILEMEADLRQATEVNEQETIARDLALEPGVIEFYGRTISCLVRNLSETGAALDVVSPCAVPHRFTLALPLEGTSRRCRLVWRKDAEMGVAFQ